jgi:putative transposase
MAIWAALRDMVLNPECGIPAMHYSDNGAYRGERHRAVMERIGSTLTYAEAYRAQARGVIERFNSSVWVPLAKTLPTYVNDDADPEAVKKALKIANESGKNLMGWQDFIEAARKKLKEYNNHPHTHLNNQAPNESWAQAVAEGWRPTLLEADDLHDLLPSLHRTVNRGWVSLPWGHYFHDRLADYHGSRVAIGVHPTDGARVWCSDERGALICVADRDGNSRPYVPASMLEEARAKREAGKVKRLERKIAAAREEGAAIIDLPHADVSAAARIHLVAPPPPQQHALDPSVRAIQERMIEEQSRQTPAPAEEPPEKRYARAWDVERRIEAGLPVEDGEREWLAIYRTGGEYRAQKAFHESFDLTPGGGDA